MPTKRHNASFLVDCDHCGQAFQPKIRVTRGKGETVWFRCEHCRHRYQSYHLTEEGIRIRDEMGELRRAGRLEEAIALEPKLHAEMTRAGSVSE